MRRLRANEGFTLVEVLIAMALMAIGIAATLGVFGGSGRATASAQRLDIASEQAQGVLDSLSKMDYSKLGLTSTPATSTDPLNPNNRVSGTTLTIRSGLQESFVLSSDSGQSAAAVDPTPTTFAVGTGDGTVTGKLYRYITWRDENCPTGLCDGTHNTKRITVAATIDPNGTFIARKPVWVSQIVPDPNALPPGSSPPASSGGPDTSAQDFYLYDTRCGNTTRQAQNGDHITHSTASSGNSSTYYSICENTTTLSNGLQPDLMGTTAPPGNSSTPLYTYSSDLAGTYDGGLVMKRQGTTCPRNYAIADTFNANNPNEWSLHAWSTNPFSSAFSFDGYVTLSLFTHTLSGTSGRGFLCATLLDRTVSNGVPQDTTIGSTTYDLANWPGALQRITFSWNVSSYDIPSGHRLVLVLGVRSESASDLVFVYDHPLYPSFLEVATSTPLP
jgi:prepilin-type N-terminal cleavage/methylation domain-containing protein